MSEVKTVRWAEGVVGDLESFSALEWGRLFAHANFVGMMDEYLTAKCLSDFWWHLRFGVYFKAWKHYDNELHKRCAYWLQDWTKTVHGMREPISQKAFVMSRELCKTQLLIAWDGWNFARDRNTRLLIRAYDAPKAEEISGALLKMLRSKKFRARYPWIMPAVREDTTQAEKWRPKQFMLLREDEDVRVPSCEAMGIKGQPTGGHFQRGHYDDFEVDVNANSEDLREDLFETWRNDVNLFMAGSRTVLAGTPWSMQGLIYGILYGKNSMEGHDIDLFKQACCNRVFDRPFEGHEPMLMGDRCTVRVAGAGYPTAMETLSTCQATVRFFSAAAKGVVEEIREVVWNDGESFRVNRPFPAMLGQPLHCVIGTDKPACPVRQTLDSQDWLPELGGEVPVEVSQHAAEPGVDGELNARFSLPMKRQKLGSRIYALQQELFGTDLGALVLNSDDLQVVTWAEVPLGPRRWRRASDFASAKKTVAATSMTTGFEMAHGFYLAHIEYQARMGTTWKLLELVLGVKRVEDWGGHLEWTSFENTGHIEEVIKELLPDVCRDPHAYFERLGKARPAPGMPTYAEYAEKYFKAGQAVPVPLKWLSRTTSKNDRLGKQQPVWESKKLFILDTCPFRQVVIDSADAFTMQSEEAFDLLDNLADLLSAGRLLRPEVKPKAGQVQDDYHRVLKEAGDKMAEAVARGVNPGWGRN